MLVLAAAMSACDSAERSIAPGSSVSARVAAGSPATLAQAFVDAQGTYCVRDIPGDCDVIDNFGLGYILSWCSLSCAVNPALSVDFAGVHRKWWDRNGPPLSPAFSYTGTVNESRIADGRRRLIVNIHARNTFVVLYSLVNGFTALVGADFNEYPGFTGPLRTPALGDASLSAELILPANFEGMPDITHFGFFPAEGMEVRRMNLSATTTGPLRVAYDGIAAGTEVKVEGTFVWLPKLGTRPVNSRRLIARGYEVSSRITVRPTRAP